MSDTKPKKRATPARAVATGTTAKASTGKKSAATTGARKKALGAEPAAKRSAKPRASAKTAAGPLLTPSPEVVAARAYQKFVERGYVHGYDLDDWSAAELELASERP